MFDISILEFTLLCGIFLIFIHPKDLPDIMEALGILGYKLKKTTKFAKHYLNETVSDAQIDKNKKL
jgi:Sec-independent protein translocase protein TatA